MIVNPSELLHPNKFPYRGNRKILYINSFAVILVVVIAIMGMLLYLHTLAKEQALANSKTLVKSLNLMFESDINTVDVALAAMSRHLRNEIYRNHSTVQEIDHYLESIQKSLPYADVIRATDERGDVLYGINSLHRRVNVADREYFEQLRKHPDLGMVIFEPHMAKTDQVWRWTFIRRINKLDGSFGGVVYVALDIDQIQSMLDRLQQNSHDVLVLRDKEFRLITRQNDDGNTVPVGGSKTIPVYRELIGQDILEGFYEVKGSQSIDGVRRLFSYRINSKYGFLIANGVNWRDVFSTWYLLVWIGCAFLVAFIVAILLLARFINQNWQREEKDILKRLEDETERKKLEEQIRHMAYYDALTDLPNRRLLSDRLGQALVNIKRSCLHGALMFIDLDNFKPLNDLYGHAVGDLLLIEVGRRLKACIREMDTVARIGGDEFIVLIGQLEGDEEKSLAHTRLIVEKIHISLSEPYQFEMHNDDHPASTIEYDCACSIGVVVFSRRAKDIDVILTAADSAMYEAKAAGRNQWNIRSSVI